MINNTMFVNSKGVLMAGLTKRFGTQPINTVNAPLYQSGKWYDTFDNPEKIMIPTEWIGKFVFKPLLCKMNDNSMEPMYHENHIVIADRDTNGNISGSDCIVQIEGKIFVRRLYRTDFGYILYGYNDTEQIVSKNITILAVVLGEIAEEKLKSYYKY